MRPFIRYSVLLLLTVIAHCGTAADLKELTQLLSGTSGIESNALKIKKERNRWEIAFCPDNTCDVIRAPGSTPANVLGDFALLYLYYASSYIYLKEFYERDAKAQAGSVLSRYGKLCPANSEFEKASCVLLALARTHHISLAFRRSDEGHTGQGALNITEELSASRIANVKHWQIEQWKTYRYDWPGR